MAFVLPAAEARIKLFSDLCTCQTRQLQFQSFCHLIWSADSSDLRRMERPIVENNQRRLTERYAPQALGMEAAYCLIDNRVQLLAVL